MTAVGALERGTGVPEWVLGEPRALRDTADACARIKGALQRAGTALQRAVFELGNSLQWSGQAATAATQHAQAKEVALDSAAMAFATAGQVIADFADHVDVARVALSAVNGQLHQARNDLQQHHTAPWGTSGWALEEWVIEKNRLVALEHDLLHETHCHLNALDQQVESFHTQLRAATGELERLSHLRVAETWVTSCSLAGSFRANLLAAMTHLNLIADERELTALDAAHANNYDELHELLGGMSHQEVSALAERHPHVAVLLTDGMGKADFVQHPWPEESAEHHMVSALAVAGTHLHRTRLITSAWMRLATTARRRLAVTYPGVFGNLAGVSYHDRFAANRVKISAALHLERQHVQRVSQRIAELNGFAAFKDSLFSQESFNNAVWTDGFYAAVLHGDTRHTHLTANLRAATRRVELYQQLLRGTLLATPAAFGPPHAASNPPRDTTIRQVLVFDRHGDGRFVEVFGDLTSARNVGVFVPGTTAALENVATYSRSKAQVALHDAADDTAMLVWLDADFPDSVITDAPNPSYARAAGQQLTDFVTTLRDTHGYAQDGGPTISVEGYSYGGAIVGVADTHGIPADHIIHTESAGLSNKVFTLNQYPAQDSLGNPRDVTRYAQTAQHDAINVTQGITHKPLTALTTYQYVHAKTVANALIFSGAPIAQAVGWLADKHLPKWHDINRAAATRSGELARYVDVFHGGDPDTTPGIIQLNPGVYGPNFHDPNRHNVAMDHDPHPITVHHNAALYDSGTWRKAQLITTGQHQHLLTR